MTNPFHDQLRTPSGSVSAAGRMGVPAADTGHNPQDLDPLRKIAEAPGVTPGPWVAYDRGIGYEVHDANGYELTGGMRETFDKADAEFIAAFDPLQVLALITRTEQAEAAVARVRELADKWEAGALRWEDPLPVPKEVFLLREALRQPTHEPDWSDYQPGDDGPSCSCGYNGPYKECWESRRALDGDGRG